MMLAKIRLRQEHRDAVAEVLGPIGETSALWMEAQLILGELEIGERQAAGAERISGTAERDSKALKPRQRLLYLYSLQQRSAEAREMLWQMYKIRDDPRILVDLVLELLVDQQDVRGLAPELAEFIAKTPDETRSSRAWGLDLLYQGRAAEALPQLEAAATSLVNDVSGRFALAECRILLGKPVEIDEVLGPMPEQPADAAQWWLFEGESRRRPGYGPRLRRLNRRLRSEKDGREAHFSAGRALERLGRSGPAKTHLELANRIDERIKSGAQGTSGGAKRGFADGRGRSLNGWANCAERLG